MSAEQKITSIMDLSYRVKKMEIRKKLLRLTQAHFNRLKAITFPGIEWQFEKDLLLSRKCDLLIALEQDSEIYNLSQMNMPVEIPQLQFLNVKDSDFFTKENFKKYGSFNFIWLDYMCPFSEKVLESIKNLFKHNFIQNGGIVALTFVKSFDASMYHLYRKVDNNYNKYYKPERTKIIPKLINQKISDFNYTVEVIDGENYTEPQRKAAMPMVFIILKAIKNIPKEKTCCSKEKTYCFTFRLGEAYAKKLEELAGKTKSKSEVIREILERELERKNKTQEEVNYVCINN